MSRLLEALDAAARDPRALKRSKLHICTYHALCMVIKTIIDEHRTAYTIHKEVADWCRKQPELEVEKVSSEGWWTIRWKEGWDARKQREQRFPV